MPRRRTSRKWQRRVVRLAIGFAAGWTVEQVVGTRPLLAGLVAISLGATCCG